MARNIRVRFAIRPEAAEAFHELVVSIVDHYGGGSTLAAVEGMEQHNLPLISQATLWRLTQRPEKIDANTLEVLERAGHRISEDFSKRLHECLATSTADELLEMHRLWSAAGRERWEREHGTAWYDYADTPPKPVSLKWRRRNRSLTLDHVLHFAEEEFPDLLGKFRKRHSKRRIGKARIEWAIVRTLLPLAEWVNCAGVERKWIELSHEERRRFIELGLDREEIMLSREPDRERAEALAMGGINALEGLKEKVTAAVAQVKGITIAEQERIEKRRAKKSGA